MDTKRTDQDLEACVSDTLGSEDDATHEMRAGKPDSGTTESKLVAQFEKDAEQKRRHLDDDHGARHALLKQIFDFVRNYVCFTLMITMTYPKMRLGENVVIALLTTTTATVVGILLVALHWLYPTGKK